MITIIIPVLNEEEILRRDEQYFAGLSAAADVVFVDGGSNDKTVELAGRLGRILQTARGRGIQKNFGAKNSHNLYLLFLHADSRIDVNALPGIAEALGEGFAAGCFRLKVDDRRGVFRFYEWLVNFRAKRLGIIDGDLGMFIRKDVFEQIGFFADMPIMEDIEFSKRLARYAKLKILNDSIRVSSRKWDELGFWHTLGVYSATYIKYWLGHDFKAAPEARYEQ